jgi:hypothetical protein
MKDFKLVVVFAVLLLLSACAGPSDWYNDELPEDYEIWRLNASEILLCKRIGETQGLTVIRSYVFEAAYSEDYIFVKQVESKEVVQDTGAHNYFIINILTGDVSGAYTREEFEALDMVIGLETFPEWKNVTKRPG